MEEFRARRPVTAASAVAALGAAGLVLLLGAAGVQANRSVTLERRAVDDAAVLTDVASGLVADLDRRLLLVDEGARTATGPGGALPAGFVPADPAAPTEAPPSLTATDRADPQVAAVLDRARDSGEAFLSPPVEVGGGPRLLAVAASYSLDPMVGRPQSTVDRRAQLVGWVVDPIDPADLLQGRLPEGAAASVEEAGVRWTATDAGTADLPVHTVEVGERQLAVRAGDPSWVEPRAITVALAVATVALAALAGLTVVEVARRLRARRAEAAEQAAQVDLIGEVAPLVQQSLELADVLPAVAVQLSDHFDLTGVALSTWTPSGGQRELFSVGEHPAPDVTPVLRPPDHLAAEETLALALQRGGRTVALLQLVTGRALHRRELQSLRALAELITAAVVNASLFASQQEAVRRLRDLDALKTVFLGTASHELRTPVTAIGGFASLLHSSWDEFDDEQRRDFVTRINANARTLSAVVQELLDFSLLDMGTVTLAIEEVDLAAVVSAVVERLGPSISSHRLEVVAHPSPTVAGNVNGLERVITNLLTNAVKFSPEGSTITLAVDPSVDGTAAEVTVSDQGPGIAPEDRSRVFERFFRGTGDAVLQTRGVGIGLSVVADLVARLQGEVVVDDAPGGGARFTVRLPAFARDPEAEEAVHAPSS